ncbi:MAG: arylsulfatase A, partial [Planctomycetota bacterium]
MSNRICLYLLLVMGCASPPEQASPLPNILILYTDDQGYGDCGAMNPNAKFATPHIDRLAREGVVFTDGHSAGSVCTPSRYALLTGRYAWRTPLGSGVLGADADCMIEDGQTTIASLLRASGYRTALFGKWHLGMQIPGEAGRRDWDQPVLDGPLQKGFDQFYGIPASMNFGVLTWFDGDRAIEPTSMWTRKKFPTAEITTPPLDYRMAPPYEPQRQTQRDIEVASGFVDEEALRIITEHAIEFIEAP